MQTMSAKPDKLVVKLSEDRFRARILLLGWTMVVPILTCALDYDLKPSYLKSYFLCITLLLVVSSKEYSY